MNNKGERNGNWRGGTSEYPNHYLMKKNRLIILFYNPVCEICKEAPATEIHHKDFSRHNHELSNLQAVCHKCHPRRLYRKPYRKNKPLIIETISSTPLITNINSPIIKEQYRNNVSVEIYQKYGMTIRELAMKLNHSRAYISYWHKNSISRLDTLLVKT